MIRTKHKNIISKRILTHIDDFIIDILHHEQFRWRDSDRKSKAIDIIDILFSELKQHKDIEQFKIICDKRNNSQHDFDQGIYHLEIIYVQAQCLNKTRLHYIFGTGVQF